MKTIVMIAGIALLTISSVAVVSAAEVARTASIVTIDGAAEVSTSANSWAAAQVGMVLKEGDSIRTKENSMVVLNLDGNGETATAEMKPNSQMKLQELKTNKEEGTEKTLLDLALGTILIKAKKLHSERSRFEVKTPTSIVGVKGTTFSVSVETIE